jgi:L-2-hydroxyglutarate oxidase LhgO
MKTNSEVDVAVIGAGVVGLAIGRLFASKGEKVCILEETDAIGTQTSARGSYVIHSGIYYVPGSLKATLCVRGKKLLYEYCEKKNINFRKLGKVIVATSEAEVETLEMLKNRGEQNGVTDLQWLSSQEVSRMEPEVKCVRGLFSPSTGIIDGQGFMSSLLLDAKSHGASVALSTSVIAGEVLNGRIILTVGGERPGKIVCRRVVNSAGLKAPEVAKSIAGIRLESIPKNYFAKGHYFRLKGPSPFSHLIYPFPVPGGLGIHSTLNARGEVRFGPDVSWIDQIDYTFEPGREKVFYEAIRKYYPALRDGALEPDHTGIRPKIAPAGSPGWDFVIQGRDEHGIAGLVNLFGIESPGFTSSLAIAQEVERMMS